MFLRPAPAAYSKYALCARRVVAAALQFDAVAWRRVQLDKRGARPGRLAIAVETRRCMLGRTGRRIARPRVLPRHARPRSRRSWRTRPDAGADLQGCGRRVDAGLRSPERAAAPRAAAIDPLSARSAAGRRRVIVRCSWCAGASSRRCWRSSKRRSGGGHLSSRRPSPPEVSQGASGCARHRLQRSLDRPARGSARVRVCVTVHHGERPMRRSEVSKPRAPASKISYAADSPSARARVCISCAENLLLQSASSNARARRAMLVNDVARVR